MARSDWLYFALDKALIAEVDRTIESVLIHGSRKYVDRKHFITAAIQKLLQKESKEMEVVAK